MSDVNSVNGYTIKQVASGEWWMLDLAGEQVAGPFATEQAAIEIASVFQDQPAPPARRRNKKN
ncbi:MAG: hypothetical protein V4749_09240 [Pseudomonadota bacterium]